MLITISEFIGHLHPVLVHLPIGILLIACLLQWLSSIPRFNGTHQALLVVLLCGMIGSILSAVSGYLLSTSDDYDETLVDTHQWFGIGTSVVAVLFYILHQRQASIQSRHATSIILFLLIVLTGHFGGTLTHGSDYLSFSGSKTVLSIEKKPIPNVQEAQVYTDIVQPLLQNKCYSCHGKNKQKGGLRMDDSARLWKGGKDGIVLIAGKPDESELIKRLLLPRNDEDHMPPKEKPQLTEQEVAVLHWWIASGAPFHKKVKEIDQSEKLKPVLLSFQHTGLQQQTISEIPLEPVKQAEEKAISNLRENGVIVLPVSKSSNYLMVSYIMGDSIHDHDLTSLLPLQQQLIWVKLGNTQITDSGLFIIAKCKNITRLQLDHTNISDTGLVSLQSLQNLQYLNLVGTRVTAQGILSLKPLKNLRSIYLYQTLIKPSEWINLKTNFPGVQIDSGGYKLPLLQGDTSEVQPKKPVEQ